MKLVWRIIPLSGGKQGVLQPAHSPPHTVRLHQRFQVSFKRNPEAPAIRALRASLVIVVRTTLTQLAVYTEVTVLIYPTILLSAAVLNALAESVES